MHPFLEKILKNFHKRKDPKPLVSHQQDVALLRQLKRKKLPSAQQVRYAGRILTSGERRLLQGSLAALCIGVIWFVGLWLLHHRGEVPAVGGRYTEALVGSPQLVNPLFSSFNDVDSDLVRLIYSGLMRYDENGALVPDLAESYTLSEDKKSYTFHLRKNVTWQDSTEESFSASDIKFTFDLIQDRSVGSPLFVGFEGAEVNVVDDYTVVFKLREPFAPFLSSLTVGILPSHIWSGIPVNQIRLARYNLQPIGTGPYSFKKLSKNETGYIDKYELARFDRFYRESVFIQEFVFSFYPQYDTDGGAVEALRSQKIDGLGFVPAHLQEKVNKKSINLYTLALPQYTALFFNLEQTGWRERKEVRDALAMALDRDRIIKESLKGDGAIVDSPILSQFHLGDTATTTPYTPDEANVFLDKNFSRIEAGEYKKTRREELLKAYASIQTATTTASSTEPAVPTEAESLELQVDKELEKELSSTQIFYRQDKDKNILTINLVTADTEEYRHTAELVAGFWQELGIKVTIEYVNPKTIEKDILKTRKYDVLLYGIILGDNPDPYPFWHSSQVKYPGVNLSQYTNRFVDTQIEKIRTVTSDEEMKKAYNEFNRLLSNDRPAIFLYSPLYRYMISTGVKGISLKQIYHPSDRFVGVHKWYIETESDWKF